MTDLHDQLKAALGVASISQAEAARQLGITAKHVNQVLNGKARLSVDLAESLAGLAGTKVQLVPEDQVGFDVALLEQTEWLRRERDYYNSKFQAASQDGDRLTGVIIGLHAQIRGLNDLVRRYRNAWASARLGRARARQQLQRVQDAIAIRSREVHDLKRRRTELIVEIDQIRQRAETAEAELLVLKTTTDRLIQAAVARVQRFQAAWWSARIGRAQARQEIAEIYEQGRDAVADQLLAETRLRAMDFRNGATMDIEPARELAAIWVACARTMLGDAENYSETKVEYDVSLAADPDNDRPKERYVLTVQRVGKVTPHEARKQAEQRAETAEAAVAHYEHTLSWNTTCHGCAKLLDTSYAETTRAETAEAERDQLRAVLRRINQLADTWEETLPDKVNTSAVVSAIRITTERVALTPGSTCTCDGDPIECSHEAARGQAEEERDQAKALLAKVRAVLPDLIRVAAYVSVGRDFVDVKPYPDSLARRALGALDDAGLKPNLDPPDEGNCAADDHDGIPYSHEETT